MSTSADLAADGLTLDTSTVRTDGVWFGDPHRPALGWLSRRDGAAGHSGIVILPPVGYGYWSAQRTLRVLAEQLASAGHTVLRFDYDGTGDSAGDQWDGERLAAWRGTAAAAVTFLRASRCRDVTLVGVRLGATIALLDGASLGATLIVAWAPVVSGRKYAREIRLLSSEVPPDEDPLEPPGTRLFAGSVFSAQTLSDLGQISLDALAAPPAAATLVVDRSSASAEPVLERLRSVGGVAETAVVEGGEQALENAPEFAVVPEAVLARICSWIGPAAEGSPVPAAGDPAPIEVGAAPEGIGAVPVGSQSSTFDWRGGSVTETVLRFGRHGHVGLLTEPVGGSVETTLVLLNPGSETHIGPGRAWVELARDLALAGRRSVRVDFRGWGESPDAGQAPGRPYDVWCEQDTIEITEGLLALGYGRLVLFGLCASAWILLRAVLQAASVGVPLAGAIALNPQMYWQQGDPVDIDWDRIRARRIEEIHSVERGHRLGLWSALDALGHRPRVARWLEDLAATDLPIELLFAEGDDGLVYLRQRAGRRLEHLTRNSRLRVRELPGVDHPMHRTWMRPRVLTALHEALEWVEQEGAGAG